MKRANIEQFQANRENNRQRILDSYIARRGNFTSRDAAHVLGCTESNANQLLKRMCLYGDLTSRYDGKKNVYRLKPASWLRVAFVDRDNGIPLGRYFPC